MSRAGLAAVAFVLFFAGVTISRVVNVDVTMRAKHDPDAYAPSYRRVAGPQLVMVYLGSASCGWSSRPDLPAAVETIRVRLARHAAEQGMSFKAVGVALDWSPAVGIEHLNKFGRFDEVSAGYNWGNTMSLRYFWGDGWAEAGTPTILVYRRVVAAPSQDEPDLFYGESDRSRLATVSGYDRIVDWAESGSALVFREISQVE